MNLEVLSFYFHFICLFIDLSQLMPRVFFICLDDIITKPLNQTGKPWQFTINKKQKCEHGLDIQDLN